MWGRKNKIVESKFWSGESITIKSISSYFGKFIKILNDLFQDENPEIVYSKLTIPKVIVIGAESGGKSSLLENIIKCPIFPRNSNICTRQPIHLILRNVTNPDNILYKITCKNKTEVITDKNQIMLKIQNIMNELENDNISSDEIHIEIHDIDLPNFEFYDLPGIRAYPTEMAQRTTQLAEYYLQQPNTIILCVVPSTTPRITSYLPIALIKKYNKEANTIIALTMADRVGQENIYDLLIKRIINDTDEFNQNEFAGCVAVINRSHVDSTTLEENDKFSNNWFLTNIINDIPEDFSKISVELINKNIGIGNLISNLDNLYNKFIKNNWIPQTITNLNSKIENFKLELDEYGIPLYELIDNDHMMDELSYRVQQMLLQLPNKICYTEFNFKIGDAFDANNWTFEEIFSNYVELYKICYNNSFSTKLLNYNNPNVTNIFFKNELQIKRFSKLINAVLKLVLNEYNQNIIKYFEYDKVECFKIFKKHFFAYINSNNSKDYNTNIDELFDRIVLDTIVICKHDIQFFTSDIKYKLDEFINLEEDEQYVKDKQKLTNELDYTIQAVQKIKNLSLQIN